MIKPLRLKPPWVNINIVKRFQSTEVRQFCLTQTQNTHKKCWNYYQSCSRFCFLHIVMKLKCKRYLLDVKLKCLKFQTILLRKCSEAA